MTQKTDTMAAASKTKAGFANSHQTGNPRGDDSRKNKGEKHFRKEKGGLTSDLAVTRGRPAWSGSDGHSWSGRCAGQLQGGPMVTPLLTPSPWGRAKPSGWFLTKRPQQ